ncbi:MAG: 50S ribosomal protein L30 [Chloroflexota bacterium]
MAKKIETQKKLRVTLIKSPIGYDRRQKDTVRALGLRRMHHTVEQMDTPVIRGMLDKIRHLVQVEELDE